MADLTLQQFIDDLIAIKDEMKDTPVKVVAENGLRFEPKAKFVPKEGGNYDITKENIDHIVITYR